MATLSDSGAWVRAELPAGEQAPKAARMALEPLREGLSPDLSRALALVASELVTNSVRHGGGEAGIELEAHVEGGVVRLSVTDWGPGFPVETPDRQPGAAGGWGLQVVDQLVDRWWVERGTGTRVTCELRRTL